MLVLILLVLMLLVLIMVFFIDIAVDRTHIISYHKNIIADNLEEGWKIFIIASKAECPPALRISGIGDLQKIAKNRSSSGLSVAFWWGGCVAGEK